MTVVVESRAVDVVVPLDMVFAVGTLEESCQSISRKPAEDGVVSVWSCVHGDVGSLFVVEPDLPWLPSFLSKSLHRPESPVVERVLNGFWTSNLAGGFECRRAVCRGVYLHRA